MAIYIPETGFLFGRSQLSVSSNKETRFLFSQQDRWISIPETEFLFGRSQLTVEYSQEIRLLKQYLRQFICYQ